MITGILEKINLERYVTFILSSLFDQMTDEDKSHCHFMQDNTTAHTANNFRDILDEVFS
jgi:hypothetical protein